jgi:hypothetical protein
LHARRECLAIAKEHSILESKVHVHRRNDSPIWHCSRYLEAKNRRVSIKEEVLPGQGLGQDWYFDLNDEGRPRRSTIHSTVFDGYRAALPHVRAAVEARECVWGGSLNLQPKVNLDLLEYSAWQ